ncbi:inovirus Gp2 family protein [Aquitalea palustris]|uniref:Inovirus Gp2 family protein n=1 Tax=Aquitalea palustris TaxID=2480983 RepID=A0A454JL74_9NEIS|nr:inovirus-type Gp2 protein [Aquitalea palustris]RMD00148.1 inovirus Gp2 family protein [Aquitalea palustris]
MTTSIKKTSPKKPSFPAKLRKELTVGNQTIHDLQDSTTLYVIPNHPSFDEEDQEWRPRFITNRRESASFFANLHNLVLRIASTNGDQFRLDLQKKVFTFRPPFKAIETYTAKATTLGAAIWNVLYQDYEQCEHDFINYTLSPLIALFLKLGKEMGIFRLRQLAHCDSRYPTNSEDIMKMNEFVDELRKQLRAPGFIQILQKHARKHRDNNKRLRDYIHELFLRNADLLVIRIDLGIRQEHAENISALSILKMFEKLMKNKKDKAIFDGLVGWARRLEAGVSKGCHLHVIFFFNAKVRNPLNDKHIADQIGKAWQHATGDIGCYFNCNSIKKNYKSVGIGRIRRNDTEGRKNLLQAADYLTKQEKVVFLIPDGKYKIFERGQLPVLTKPKVKVPTIISLADELAGLGDYAKISPTCQ